MSRSPGRFAGAAATALLSIGTMLAVAPAAAQDDSGWTGSGSYVRVVDVDSEHRRLDMAVRLLVPRDGDGPTVALAGALHIAEADFYHLLQSFLDSQDLVLFEGVRPRGVGGIAGETDEARRRRTQARIRFVAIMLHRQYGAKGEYPNSLDDLVAALEDKSPQQAEWVKSSSVDAWGQALVYKATTDGFDLLSLGADGTVGGEGPDADVAFADQKALSGAETGEDPGLQSEMAKALGLAFQLDELHHDGPKYRNSDLTIDQIVERVEARGGDASVLFRILDGSSISGRLARFMLGIVQRSGRMQAMMRVILVEMLASTDLENLATSPGLPKEMAELMHVIVIDRNQVVVEDLKSVLDGKDVPKSIGIVYGAGHLGDMEKRIVSECGYRYAGGFWLPAIHVDLSESGLTHADLARMRTMIEALQGGGPDR